MSTSMPGKSASDPMPAKTHDFIVRLDGLKIDEGARQRIAQALQSAALSELGRLDLHGRESTVVIHTPKEWLGRWLREVGHLEGLQDIERKLGVKEL